MASTHCDAPPAVRLEAGATTSVVPISRGTGLSSRVLGVVLIGPITMGPGGWVSVKGAPAPRSHTRRPWWAVLLRAQPPER